jgi:hypothetical protein
MTIRRISIKLHSAVQPHFYNFLINPFFMKNTLKLLMLTLFVGTLSMSTAMAQKAKKVDMKKPDKVALAFMQRFSSFDFKGAKELSTKESYSLFDMFEMAIGMQSPEELEKAKAESKEGSKNIKKATCKVTGDEAKCTLCCDASNQPMADSDLTLKKTDGKWFVHMSKEDMREEAPIEEPTDEEGE